MAHGNHQLDTSIEIVTPENVSFRYHVAGPFRRLPAFLIDLALQAVLLMIAAMGVQFMSVAFGLSGFFLGMGGFLIFWFVLSWFYGGLFETYWNGQTPGKRLMRIRVIGTDGQPINGLQAVLRNLLRAIDCQPMYMFSLNRQLIMAGFLYQFGLFSTLMNNRFQRLGDLAAGTMVIVEERQWFQGIIQIDEPDVIRLVQQIPPSFQASPSLARALAAYVQRRLAFPAMRRIEVARHLAEPLARRFGLPEGINPDHLLCAAYQRAFITDTPGDVVEPVSPFAKTASLAIDAASAGRMPVEVGESPFAALPTSEGSRP
ncbi:MAG: RDD family protein [Planctomycetaceae bacterium]|nr:RDD family protein [Planctomycetaceae bacterium]